LITAAYKAIGVVGSGGTPTSDQLSEGLLLYNTMTKSWSSYGLDTWARATGTITCVAGQTSYTIGPGGDVDMARPIRIIGDNVYRTNGNTDTPLFQYSKQEYFYLSDKDSTGTPTQYYYDQEDPIGNFYIWPVPDSALLPLSIVFDCRIPIAESTLAAEPNLPDYWQSALIYNLALELATINGRQVTPNLQKLADQHLTLARGTEYEQASTYRQPNYSFGSWGK